MGPTARTAQKVVSEERMASRSLERKGRERRAKEAGAEAVGDTGLERVEREELVVLRWVAGGDGGGAAVEVEHAEEAHPVGWRQLRAAMAWVSPVASSGSARPGLLLGFGLSRWRREDGGVVVVREKVEGREWWGTKASACPPFIRPWRRRPKGWVGHAPRLVRCG